MAVACAAMLSLCGPIAAGEGGALSRMDLDGRANKVLAEVINLGAPLFNGGDQVGCYRLYHGALMVLEPLLDHRPSLQQAIQRGLSDAGKKARTADRAFVLRAVIDRVREELAAPVVGTLWDRLGGEKAVTRVVDDFVVLAAKNPKVDFTRGGRFSLDAEGVAVLKRHLVAFLSAATGGPLKYTGRSMKAAHKGMAITDAEFNALAGDLQTALRQNGVAADVNAILQAVGTTRGDIVETKMPGDTR
jgi:hemoglobin